MLKSAALSPLSLVLTTFASLPTPASAGWVVNQTVEASLNGTKELRKHTWHVEDEKFQLEVEDGGSTQYIFNGKTFYVCGKLDDAQLKAMSSDAKIMGDYLGGVCQVVPSNFMARFFLSPLAAVESVDASDGMRVTLSIEGYKLEAGTALQVSGQTCVDKRRTYGIARRADQGSPSGTAFHTEAQEALCSTEAVGWRQGLWREVQKAVLRQPGGAALMKRLKGDLGDFGGLALKGTVDLTMKDKGGKTHKGVYTLATTSVRDEAIAAARFKMPEGYKLFSPEGVDLAKLSSDLPKGAPAKEDSLLNMFESAIFCAIAGYLGCFTR